MHSDTKLLSFDEIHRIAPRSLISQMIAGVKRTSNLYIGVMLNHDDKESSILRRMVNYIANEVDRSPYCKLLDSIPDRRAINRCRECVTANFDKTKELVSSNPNCRGYSFSCVPGGLQSFVVPIVESEANTFIGAIFGGQRVPEVSDRELRRLLIDIVNTDGNEYLRSLPFKKLWNAYRMVDKATTEDNVNMKAVVENLAKDLADHFALFAKQKKMELDIRIEQQAINQIYENIIEAADIAGLRHSLSASLPKLMEWLQFDWCLFMVANDPDDKVIPLTVVDVTGRGLGAHERLIGKQFIYPKDTLLEIQTPENNPVFLMAQVRSMASERSECWWIPMISRDDSIFAALVIGSAPGHSNTTYDPKRIADRMPRTAEVFSRIATQYRELRALDMERRKSEEAEENLEKAREASRALENLLLTLTHQMNRPLIMIQTAFENYRNLKGKAQQEVLETHLELGGIVAGHTQLMCKGISKAIVAEGGGRFDSRPVLIDAKTELMGLCGVMDRLSDREDLRFEFFSEEPTIYMDRDSFLYVFYVLLDNAIKYSDPGTTIQLACDEERDIADYALKVKSMGLPIPPGTEHKVFERGWRGPDAWRSDETGIGVGCWAARRHMDYHNGTIRLETKGRLSVFVVCPPKYEVR